ncbi:hypothetical protein D9M68_769420 [compost metagenome]
MVAMLGRIMPAPLAMPLTVTVLPPTTAWRLMALGRVSVVMIPSAALSHCEPVAPSAPPASDNAAGSPASRRSRGKGSMITPVEKGSTCSCCTPRASAMALAVWRAFCSPGSPVPALALPVLMTMARMPCPAAK